MVLTLPSFAKAKPTFPFQGRNKILTINNNLFSKTPLLFSRRGGYALSVLGVVISSKTPSIFSKTNLFSNQTMVKPNISKFLVRS